MPRTTGEPNPTDVQPLRSRTHRMGEGDASMERNLTEVSEAHWKVPARVATLEDEIKWQSHPSPGVSWRLKPTPGPGITTEIQGTEEEVPPGAAGRLPCPPFQISPLLEGL